MRSELGEVKLVVDYGQDANTGQWGCPVRAAWQLGPHQKLTPGFAEKLCFTATATGSYEEAAQVASRWAQSMDDATLHALVQRMGARAEAQAQSRYEQPPVERLPQRGSSELGVLMVDGCQLRYRGPGWGKPKTQKDRVEWHELKLGVFYRHEESAHTETGRGLLADKIVVNWQDQSGELGRRLNWEALREGLGRAEQLLYLGDGAEWVWNLKQDRWNGAVELLDFYHGSEHLWNLGRALYGEKEPALAQWVEPLRHQVRHGQEKRALRQIAHLKQRRGETGKVIRREQNYFASLGIALAFTSPLATATCAKSSLCFSESSKPKETNRRGDCPSLRICGVNSAATSNTRGCWKFRNSWVPRQRIRHHHAEVLAVRW